jgi:hypothetical protein
MVQNMSSILVLKQSETCHSAKLENRVKHFLFLPTCAPKALFTSLKAFVRAVAKNPNGKICFG